MLNSVCQAESLGGQLPIALGNADQVWDHSLQLLTNLDLAPQLGRKDPCKQHGFVVELVWKAVSALPYVVRATNLLVLTPFQMSVAM
jgi:hypothetical protein